MDNIVTTIVIVSRDRAFFAAFCPPTGSTGYGTQNKHPLLGFAPPTAFSP